MKADDAYAAWKRKTWQQPLHCGPAGCALVVIAAAVTLGGVVVAAVWYNSSSSTRGTSWAHALAYGLAGLGALAFVALRPYAWRFTREYRELRERENESLFLLMYEATPGAEHPETDEIPGAFVNCWVYAESQYEADLLAQVLIQEAGWIVGDADRICKIEADEIDPDDPDFAYIEQAKLDREVLVFHTYPVDEIEDSED